MTSPASKVFAHYMDCLNDDVSPGMDDAAGIAPGVYLDLDEDVYRKIPALSNSGMKDLLVSDLEFYDRHLDPFRPEPKKSDSLDFGKAVHCRILEPKRFSKKYVRALSAAAYPKLLKSQEQLREWLRDRGHKVSGTKDELAARIVQTGEDHPAIWDVELAAYEKKHSGKTFLTEEEADSIEIMAALVAADPYTKHLFVGGMPEVSIIVRDPDTGVLLKGRLDYMTSHATSDLKSFTNPRGKPIEKVIADAMYYEGYYKQLAFYRRLRELARVQLLSGEIEIHGECSEKWRDGFLKNAKHSAIVLFVESERPFHMALRELREWEVEGAEKNRYWSAAEQHINTMIGRYADCLERYGDRQWREPAEPRVMTDSDFPQLIYT